MRIKATEVDSAEVDTLIARDLGLRLKALSLAEKSHPAEEVGAGFELIADGVVTDVAKNANVFDPVPGDKFVPCALYFFHFQMDEQSVWNQQVYFWPEGDPEDRPHWRPISPDRAKEITQTLTENARKPLAEQNPLPLALVDIDDCVWREISYVVFLIDEENWRFSQSRVTGNAAVVCHIKNGSMPNHSFYDAELFDIHPAPVASSAVSLRSAFLMINYMTDATGMHLDVHMAETFNFRLFFEVKTIPPTTAAIWVDPGGTNLGPMRPPPP